MTELLFIHSWTIESSQAEDLRAIRVANDPGITRSCIHMNAALSGTNFVRLYQPFGDVLFDTLLCPLTADLVPYGMPQKYDSFSTVLHSNKTSYACASKYFH